MKGRVGVIEPALLIVILDGVELCQQPVQFIGGIRFDLFDHKKLRRSRAELNGRRVGRIGGRQQLNLNRNVYHLSGDSVGGRVCRGWNKCRAVVREPSCSVVNREPECAGVGVGNRQTVV